jgi:hypothetical protein
MRAPRDILKHVSVEKAKGKRDCGRDKAHSIVKGEMCLVVREGSFSGSKNYCLDCSKPILAAAKIKLSSLDHDLFEFEPTIVTT